MPAPNKPNTTKARQAKAKKAAIKKAKAINPKGTVDDVLKALWAAIDKVSTAVSDLDPSSYATEENDNKTQYVHDLCRLTHTLSQAGSTYSKLIETGEIEARLTALEQLQVQAQ